MILAKSVARPDGMVMAGEGLQLTDDLLGRLKDAGVASVVVKGRPMPDPDNGDVDLTKMQSRLNHLFRKYQQNTLMWTLRNMIDQYLEQIIALREEESRLEREQELSVQPPEGQKI
jgi:hypothetical protein